MTQDDEAAEIILELLSDGRGRTTAEVENDLADRGVECTDRVVRVIMMLRHRNKIEGYFSVEERAWVWTVAV